MRRPAVSLLTLALVASGVSLGAATARDASAEPLAITGATLEWAVSEEANSGAFNGQCNFMSGGESDGSAATYRATDGGATVLKLTAAGAHDPVSDYSTRCLDANGTRVTPGGTARLGQKVRYRGGTGTVDPLTGEVSIRWRGTFSVNYYGQLTPFWFTDPHLTVGADGRGVVTATVGGYASSIDDPEGRERIEPVPGIVIATLRDVDSDDRDGFVATPDYEGVAVDGTEVPQIRVLPGWGSWPSPLVEVMEGLGLGAYWYTSGGAADPRKPPAPMVVGYGTGVAPGTTTTAPGASTTTAPGASTTPTTAPPTTSTPPTTPPTTTATSPPGGPTATSPLPAADGGDLTVTAVVPDRRGDPGTEVEGGAEGAVPVPEDRFSWTVDGSSGGVALERVPGDEGEYRFAGELSRITVTDTRTAAPGWSLSGQVSDFTGGLSGRHLGWTPRVASPGAGATPGGPVVSGMLAGDGLRNPAVLASAVAGHPTGSATLGADVELRVPASTPAGTYTATLTITALG